jgi:hypothetical protein
MKRFLWISFIAICLTMIAFIYFIDEGTAFMLAATSGNSGGTPRLASFIGFAPILLVGAWAAVTVAVRDLRSWLKKRKKLRQKGRRDG